MTRPLPTTMQAMLLENYRDDVREAIDGLTVVERPVPDIGRGEVLIRLEAAPCNPSDLLLLQGKYGVRKTLPAVPGWEGTGRVVASGGGLWPRWLRGKRVAFGVQGDRDGTWAEFVAADASMCIPVRDTLPVEQAATLIINPMTAMGLLDLARRNGHKAAIHTAAASQLGRMLLVMANDLDFPIIHVVRRDAQVELLRELDAKYVLNSSDDDYPERLGELCAELSATVAFEAVAGESTGVVANCMPDGSVVYVYGALSESPCCDIDPVQLIFHGKTITGFFLGAWLQHRGKLGTLRVANRVQKLMIDGRIATKARAQVRFSDMAQSLREYVDHMTDGKVLLRPDQSD